MKLPPISKKIYSVLVIFVLLVGIAIGGILVLKSQKGSADSSITDKISQLWEKGFEFEPQDSEADFDNDGISDENEKLLGTDYRNPDSDGDGYLDGEEISAGYDPLRPAPGDKLREGETMEARALPENLTKALGESLSGKLSEGQFEPFEIGEDVSFLDAGSVDETIQEGLGNALIATAREYSLQEIDDSEIIISNNNSKEAIKAFSQKVIEALTQASEDAQKRRKASLSELAAISQAIQIRDFQDLDIYIDSYEKSYERVREIPVPVDWKELHKQHLSILQTHAKILKAVRGMSDDPLKATVALQQYSAIIDATLELAKAGIALAENLNE